VTVTEAASLDPQGLIGGVQAGYDVQAGRLVLGVEADISFGNGDAAFTDNSVLAASVELGAEGTLTARIGLPAGELVPYIKGGLAWTRVNVTGDLLHDGAPSGGRHAIEDTETLTGWTIGGGLEYALHDHWTTRAEYLYADYGSFSTTNSEGDTFRHELETHSLRLCVNYKFGD
jgi:outer membrane immunogenic protein